MPRVKKHKLIKPKPGFCSYCQRLRAKWFNEMAKTEEMRGIIRALYPFAKVHVDTHVDCIPLVKRMVKKAEPWAYPHRLNGEEENPHE